MLQEGLRDHGSPGLPTAIGSSPRSGRNVGLEAPGFLVVFSDTLLKR